MGYQRRVHGGSVQEGDTVSFEREYDDRRGKYRAAQVKLVEGGRPTLPPAPTERENGVIARWNFDKGFGFIKPEGDTGDLFAHVSALTDGDGSVQDGDSVSYMREYNAGRGKWQAKDVRKEAGAPAYQEPAAADMPVEETEEEVN